MRSRACALQQFDHGDSAVAQTAGHHRHRPARTLSLRQSGAAERIPVSAGAFQIFPFDASQPSHTVKGFLSFFRHFGVEIFVFLSAFDLAKSQWDHQS
jgi:hypothetical protein